MSKIILLFLILFNSIDTFSQEKNQEFILKGTYQGDLTFLTLSYMDSNEIWVTDTLKIHEGGFYTKGQIYEQNQARIQGDLDLTSNPDENRVVFFLEPGEISIRLIENRFQEIEVSGSEMQDEYERLNKKVKPYDKKIRHIITQLNELKNSETGLSLVKEDSLSSLWNKEKDNIREVEVKYASQNPNSHLSAYLLSRYHTMINVDSLTKYYHQMSEEVKGSYYGKETKYYLDFLEKSKIGKAAPEFAKEFLLEGDDIKLKEFKGRVVLLDFWAGWCLPCRRSMPKIMEFYNTHKSIGLEIIGISLDRDQEKWKKAIKEEGIEEWHHVFTGLKRPNLVTQYGISAIPSYVLIDRDGVIFGRYTDFSEELEAKILEAFEK